MPLAFYLDFATKQEGLRRFIDSKGLLTPRIGSLSCRPLPPSDNKGRDLAVIKQILHGYILSERKIRDPMIPRMILFISLSVSNDSECKCLTAHQSCAVDSLHDANKLGVDI